MKKYMFLLVSALFLLGMGMSSCSSDDNDNGYQPVKSFRGVRVNTVEKQNLPTWLVEKVDNYVSSGTYLLVKKGSYQGQTFYWLDVIGSSCQFCELYDANGVWFNETKKYSDDDISNLTDNNLWEIVYSYPSIEELIIWWENNSDQ